MANTKTNNPTETTSADAAAQITALLDQLDALIASYPEPDVVRKRAVRSNARFAGELVSPTITAVTNYEPLRARKLFDVEAGRQALAFRDDFRPFAQRIAVIASKIDFAVDDKLADAAIDALQTYQWSKRHAKQPDGAGLRPYVDEMQRVVEKTLNHRAKPENTGNNTPAPKELVTV
jgi:hypothetical protein